MMVFDADVVLTSLGGGNDILNDQPVLVYLENLTIDTDKFNSKDFFNKEREGLIILSIAGQTTSFPYRGTGPAVSPDKKFLNKVVYLGGNPGSLGIGISLIESDAEARKVLNTIATWTETLSNVPLLTAAHPAIGPGLGLMSTIAKLIKARTKDDYEAQAFCVCDEKLKDGRQITVKFSRSPGDAPLLEVVFKVVGLNTGVALDRISVRVENPQIKLDENMVHLDNTSSTQPDSTNDNDGTFSGPSNTPEKSSDIKPWFARDTKNVFNFDAASGKSTYNYKSASGDVKQASGKGIVAWGKNEIFTIKAADAAGAAGAKKLLPLSLTFAINPQKLDTTGVLDLLNKGTALTSVLMPEATKVSEVLKKQAPSVLNYLSEITEESLSLYSFNGLVVLSDTPVKVPFGEGKGVLFATNVSGSNKWTKQVDNDITWNGKKIGTFSFKLELASV